MSLGGLLLFCFSFTWNSYLHGTALFSVVSFWHEGQPLLGGHSTPDDNDNELVHSNKELKKEKLSVNGIPVILYTIALLGYHGFRVKKGCLIAHKFSVYF